MVRGNYNLSSHLSEFQVKYAFCTAPVDMEVDNGVARTCFVRIARRRV